MQSVRVNGQAVEQGDLAARVAGARAPRWRSLWVRTPSKWGNGEDKHCRFAHHAVASRHRCAIWWDRAKDRPVAIPPCRMSTQSVRSHQRHRSTLPASKPIVSWHFPQPRTIAMYTLTSGAHAPAPSNWTLEASDDGQHWTVLDTRHHQRFPWARQTRVFGDSAAREACLHRLSLSYRVSRWRDCITLSAPLKYSLGESRNSVLKSGKHAESRLSRGRPRQDAL
jgi:hypothetical protein